LSERFRATRYLEDPPSWTAEFREADVPVYGLAGRPFGLRCRSASMSGGNRGVESVSLEFVGDAAGVPVALEVSSSDPSYGDDIELSRVPPAPGVGGAPVTTLRAYLRGRRRRYGGLAGRSPRILALGGRLFHGELLHPGDEPRQTSFVFRAADVTVWGESTGLLDDELMGVLGQLVPLNDRPDLLARHEQEMGEHRGPGVPDVEPPLIAPSGQPPLSAFDHVRAVAGAPPGGAPHAWLIHLWGGPRAPESTAFEVSNGALVPEQERLVLKSMPDEELSPEFRLLLAQGWQRGKPVAPPSLFSLADGPDGRLLDSHQALARAEELGRMAYRESTGAVLRRMYLGAEEDGAVVSGVRYDAPDGASRLILLLDAHTASLIFSGFSPEAGRHDSALRSRVPNGGWPASAPCDRPGRVLSRRPLTAIATRTAGACQMAEPGAARGAARWRRLTVLGLLGLFWALAAGLILALRLTAMAPRILPPDDAARHWAYALGAAAPAALAAVALSRWHFACGQHRAVWIRDWFVMGILAALGAVAGGAVVFAAAFLLDILPSYRAEEWGGKPAWMAVPVVLVVMWFLGF
jgi:hypothetical protein